MNACRVALASAATAFDRLEGLWRHPRTRRSLAVALATAFCLSVASIELARLDVLPRLLGHPMPTNHFHAISWVITLLLIVEVLDLVFGLAASFSRAIGMQLEILSLVLLRKGFDELPAFPEPLDVEGHLDALLRIGSQAGGATLLFGLLIAFRVTIARTARDLDTPKFVGFISFKKLVCVGLLIIFIALGGFVGIESLTLEHAEGTLPLHFFEWFYTALVFADVLIVLASLASDPGYATTFRNFGYALVTVTIRLALSTQAHINAALALCAGGLALAIAVLYRTSQRAQAIGPTDTDRASTYGSGGPEKRRPPESTNAPQA